MTSFIYVHQIKRLVNLHHVSQLWYMNGYACFEFADPEDIMKVSMSESEFESLIYKVL